MQAIILAAGMGKRLKDLTQNNTKCMVKVNGVSLIERMLAQLDALTLDRIVIVIGYEGHKLKEYIASLSVITPILYVENPIYDKTNNIYSLALAKEHLVEDDTILLESDLIFEDSVLQMLLDDPRETLALVDKYESWMDGTCIKLGEDDSIAEFVPGKKFVFEDIPEYYKTVNIYKFSKHFSETHYVPFLEAYSKALGNNEYYEQVLRVITMLDEPEIKAKKLTGQLWYEIDDIQDLDIASSIFVQDHSKKLQKIARRWGGYWRYPKLLNMAYPCNPFFPPIRLVNEIKANIEKLISGYPSGMDVNALLVAKNLGLSASYTVASNGVEEIIHCIMETVQGSVGCVKPTNEELANRCGQERMKSFTPANKNLSYTAKDVITYFEGEDIAALVLVNPEYHTGNYIEKSGVMEILKWSREKDIKVIVDESYSDFADEPDNSLMNAAVLKNFSNVLVMKNISVACGVSGLRLGCAASADREWLSRIRQNLSIWNINSFAEFYLQIEEKYQKEYVFSLTKFREVKEKFIGRLSEIPGIYVIPSRANYCLCELENGMTSKEVAERLLNEYSILIKDMTDQIHNGCQYIKIAIRNDIDNERLLEALREIFQKDEQCRDRIVGEAVKVDETVTENFFQTRVSRKLPHRYNYVIYQDSTPQLALERDTYEKKMITPFLKINGESMVLDIGCGVGRWGDAIVPLLTSGRYIGVDFSESFLEIANKNLGESGKCAFYKSSFQEADDVLHHNGYTTFDIVLINGVLMYINDDDLKTCLECVDHFTHKESRIYIKESVGATERFTLNNFYSKELNSRYNAIYRSRDEYDALFRETYFDRGYRLIRNDATWKRELKNRKETLSWYWIIEK